MSFILPNGYLKGNPVGLNIPNPDLNYPGIYIIAVKANISSNGIISKGNDTFLPFYSGMVKCQSQIYNRVLDHYNKYSALLPPASFRGGLFNFSVGQNVCRIYDSIELFNKSWIDVVASPKGSLHKHRFYYEMDELENFGSEDYLIYFQCSSFLNYKLNKVIATAFWGDQSQGAVRAAYGMPGTGPRGANLAAAYDSLKDFLQDSFYFVYLPLPGFTNAQILEKEADCKYFLQNDYSIFTANQLETTIGRTRYKALIDNPGAFANPFGFNVPAVPGGISLQDIIFRRDLICTPNSTLTNILQRVNRRLNN